MNRMTLIGYRKGDDVVVVLDANGYSRNATQPPLEAALRADGYECIGEYDIEDIPFNMEKKGWPLEIALRPHPKPSAPA